MAVAFFALRPRGGQPLSKERAVVVEIARAELLRNLLVYKKGEPLGFESDLAAFCVSGRLDTGRTAAAGADKTRHGKTSRAF